MTPAKNPDKSPAKNSSVQRRHRSALTDGYIDRVEAAAGFGSGISLFADRATTASADERHQKEDD